MKTQTKTFASFKTWKTASGYGQWLLNSTTCAFERIPYDIFLQVILKETMDEEHLPQQPLQRRSSRPTQSRRPGWWCWEWTWPSLTSWSGYTDTTETHQQHIINEVSSSLENILVLFFCEGVLSENMRKTCCINGTETRPPPTTPALVDLKWMKPAPTHLLCSDVLCDTWLNQKNLLSCSHRHITNQVIARRSKRVLWRLFRFFVGHVNCLSEAAWSKHRSPQRH